MQVEREKLLNALNMVSHGLSQRDVVEQASCFVFQKGRIITFNDEVACSCDSPLAINGAVQAEPFTGLLSKMKEDLLEITETENELTIKGKGRKAGLIKENEIKLPVESIEVPKKWKSLPAEFPEAVTWVQDCAGKDEANFSLTCIHIHPKFLEAFDNYQFARYKIELDLKEEFLVRQVSLRTILNLSMTEFSEGKDWVHFRNSDKLMLSCRRWLDEFQDLSVIAKAKGEPASLPSSMIDGADRAHIFSESNDDKGQITVELNEGYVILKGEGAYGWYTEKKKVQYNGKHLSFKIHPDMLIQLLKKDDKRKCSINERLLKVEAGHGIYITSLIPTNA